MATKSCYGYSASSMWLEQTSKRAGVRKSNGVPEALVAKALDPKDPTLWISCIGKPVPAIIYASRPLIVMSQRLRTTEVVGGSLAFLT